MYAFDFCGVCGTLTRFGKQAHAELLGLKAIGFWVGACGTRGQGPPAQRLSLPFDTPEGAWPLSRLVLLKAAALHSGSLVRVQLGSCEHVT